MNANDIVDIRYQQTGQSTTTNELTETTGTQRPQGQVPMILYFLSLAETLPTP